MRHLLDTNACIDYLTGRYPKVIARIQGASPRQLCLSSVVVAELRYGADHSARRRTNHGRIDARCSTNWSASTSIYRPPRPTAACAHASRPPGTPIGPNDMLIAAHALSLELTVVTDDVAEFRRRRRGCESRAGGELVRRSGGSSAVQPVQGDPPVGHHQHGLEQRGRVVQRVAVDHQQVGLEAGSDGARARRSPGPGRQWRWRR